MIGRISEVVVDCPDPRALAAFYGELLGMRVTYEAHDWVTIEGEGSAMKLAFQRAPDLREPRWPDPERPQQLHLDIAVDDVEVAEPRVLALGAKRLPDGGADFRVYADPAGHPFCLVWG